MASVPSGLQSTLTPWVLAQYGATMSCARAWEAQLAALVGAASLKSSSRKKVALEKAVKESVRRSWHLLHKASASELRNLLREKSHPSVSEELLGEIGALIKWRDFLAHRYLRSRVYGATGVHPTPEHALELFRLGQAFSESSVRIGEATQVILAAIEPPDDMPEGVREAFERLAAPVATAQPGLFTGQMSALAEASSETS